MTLTQYEETYDHFYSPRFVVQVGGRRVREADGEISGLTVRTSLGKANHVSFTLNHPYDHERGAFETGDGQVEAGTSLRVEMGYGSTLRPLFDGVVDSVQPSFPASGGPTVSVNGVDHTQAMTEGADSRSWDDTSLSDVYEEVLGEYAFDGVDVDLPARSDLERRKLVQNERSDYDFLVRKLADRYGFELYQRDGTVHVRDPRPDASPVATLTYGKSLQSFRPALESEDVAVGEVTVRDWDPKQKSDISATATVPEGGDETQTSAVPVESTQEAQVIAEARAYDLTPTIGCQCETIGLPEIRAGTVVALEGLGDRFSGSYYVRTTTHRMDDAGYTTSFEGRETAPLQS